MIDLSLLLEREEVQLDISSMSKFIKEKVVIVTGAGGSIGSEICRQILKLDPRQLLLFGRGETSIYQIERELLSKEYNTEIVAIIGDIQNKTRLDTIFDQYHPDIVYHAAASKHVPLMESNPTEAVLNNLIGTKNLADIANKYQVESFVMVSTDKAVKPTSVMGASKRIAELLIQSMNKESDTKFSLVRFGNVLGSRGSVVPLFQEQIDNGGPITITHKDATRYFMTIPEASKLVIQAGVHAMGGEIFILDMGEPVKIIDLATRMIELNGKSLENIKIIEIGMRPGEKIHEHLMSTQEIVSDKILAKTFVSISKPCSKEEVLSIITSLFGLDDLNLKRAIIYEANQH